MFAIPLLGLGMALASPPALREGSVVAPTFALAQGLRWSAGTAFVAATSEGPIAFSALHHFGPAGGLRYQMTAWEVARDASMTAVDLVSGRKVVARVRARADTQSAVEREDWARDVVTFAVPVNPKGRSGGPVVVAPLPLAEGCPALGQELWVPGDGRDAAQGAPFLPAVTVACDGRTLEVRFALRELNAGGLAGSPIVDGAGRVYGMLVASSAEGEETRGFGPTADTLAAHVRHTPLPAGKPPPPPPPPPSPWGSLETGWAPIPNPWGYDLPGLHAKLLPEWGLSGRNDTELQTWLGPGPFGATFADVSRLSWADNSGNFRRIYTLVDGWNDAYRAAEVPVRMALAASGQTLAWMAWYRYGTLDVRIGTQHVRADVVARMDSLNVADNVPTLLDYDAGVVLPVEELRDTQLYGVWTRLDPAAKDPLAAGLLAELDAAIGSEGTATLVRTAPARRGVEAVRRSIRSRMRCSNFSVGPLAWWGLSADTRATLSSVVGSGRCAPITHDELARLDAAYGILQAEPGLEAALSGLLAHLTRSLAFEAAAMRLACTDCGWAGRLAPGVAAAFADPGTRMVAAARLCTRAEADKALQAVLDPLAACTGRDVSAAAARGWPAGWGPTEVEVGPVPTLPVRWPRDP